MLRCAVAVGKSKRSRNSGIEAFVRSSFQKLAPLNASCIVHSEQLDGSASNRGNTFDNHVARNRIDAGEVGPFRGLQR
jgi:hypothetical protein